jgi:hypothetical protein
MVFSVPSAATAASKLAAAAKEFGANASEPAPASAPMKVISAASARAVTRPRVTVIAASFDHLVICKLRMT